MLMKLNREDVRNHALELGFDAVGFVAAREARHALPFRKWLEAGYQAEMHWLSRNVERRLNPAEVVPNARSVIMVAVHYFVEQPPAELWDDPLRGRVARYAWGKDYHDVILPKLMALADWLRAQTPETSQTRAYVDTGPLLERTWAADAGLGFIGKNSLLIRPGYGSYCFLGGIITTLDIEPDEPATQEGAVLGKGECGSCTRCLNICPTHAFPAPYIVDSKRCISYLTIEHKGAIPEALRDKMGNWIYGCDACQEVCPWVRQYTTPSSEHFLAFDAERFAPYLPDLVRLDDEGFRARYRGTPLKRTKRRGLLRNAAIALGNSGLPEALPALRHAANDPEPLIAEHAVWAIKRIEATTS